jgi:type I R-M system S protein (fragment)
MVEWQTVRLGNIASTNQSTYSLKEDWKFVNYLDTGNITMNQVDEIQYINTSMDKLPSRAKRKVRFNSIIYSTVRPNQLHYGIIKNQPENFLVSSGFAVIDVDFDKAVPEYIYYILSQQEITEYLQSIAEQSVSAYPSIKPSDIENLEFLLPDRKTQEKIVSILRSIDEKIVQNNEINNNLQEQMEALHRSWFIDYAPFGDAKPSNWIKADIYSIANIIYGAPFASKLFNTEGLGNPIIRIRDLKEQTFVTYTTEIHPKGHLIQPGDIVVGMDGEFRPYIWGNSEAWLNQRVCIFESKLPSDKAFMLYTIKPLLNVIEQTQVATTVIHIGKKDYDAFEIVLPDRKTLDQFGEITTPMLERIVNNSIENKKLVQLRDALLPQLMSGELDVSKIKN